MQVFPNSAEDKLGFGVLRERLGGFVLSRLGEERLHGLRPASGAGPLRAVLEETGELQAALRFDDPVPLEHVLDVREVVRRAQPEEAFVSPEDLLAVRLVLSTLRRLRQYFDARTEKYPRVATLAGRMTALPEIERRIEQIIDDEARVRDDASPELLRLRRLLVRRQAQLRDLLMEELRRAVQSGYAAEEQLTLRNGRMVIPVRAEAKRRVQGFVQDTSATGQTVYIEPAAVLDLNNEIREIEVAEVREVERILREATALIRAEAEPMRENMRALGIFDLLQAKARLANELGALVPELNEEGVVRIRKGRNPVLLLHFRRQSAGEGAARRVVPLDLELGAGFRTLVITGPNAGGKSVAMKSVGLFCLMLAYGLPVPVDVGSTFPAFEQLFVDIGDEQSIEDDLSTFSSHLANLRFMLERAGERTLILIDEAGTGTDPAEGGALAQAALERFTSAGARTIVTTHHGTLKAYAAEADAVENGSMQFDQETLSPTYRFQAGIPGSSYAFEIAARMQLPEPVLARARALVGTQKTALESLIAEFEARNRLLEDRLAEAEQTAGRAAEERATYEEQTRRMRELKDRIRQDALREAERLVQEANARVERTIRVIKETQAEREATRTARGDLEQFRRTLEQRRQKAERREGASRSPAPRESTPPAAPRELRVGDQVVLDGGTTPAEVLEIEGQEAVIALGSMRMRAKVSRLTRVGGPRPQQVTIGQAAARPMIALHARTAVDLRGRRVDEALQEIVGFLDEAVAAGLREVQILHGKGTGALRQAIQDYLESHPDVAGFEEAAWNQGGAGVTVVKLKN